MALARALAVDPRVLLLDEPFGALDAQVRKDLRSWLREIHDRTGHTTVFVTHDQDEALELSDRVAILSRGRIEQIGTPEDVYERPQTPFVFGFIGDSNRLEVEISGGRVLLGGQAIDCPLPACPQGPAHLYFRPQHTRLGAPETGLPARVHEIHGVGALLRARLRLQSVDTLVESHVPEGGDLQIGQTVGLHLTQGRAFPVDREGNRPPAADDTCGFGA